MQPLVPYLLGQPHPKGSRLVNSQKSFRAEDIEEVGDNRHTTFFEMLGNWSLGDYFKEQQLSWFFEFLTTVVGLDPQKLYVTVFAGDESAGVDADTQSVAIWQRLFASVGIDAKAVTLGTEAEGARMGMQGGRIFSYSSKKNWWSRSGVPENMPIGEPGGPDSEVFYEFSQIQHDPAFGSECHPNCDCGRFMEIGNSVFMQFVKTETGFSPLPKQNVDFGGGLERILAAAHDNPDVFTTDLFASAISLLETASHKSYQDPQYQASMRVVADHVRGAVMMASEGLVASNKGQGYILRRLLRRSVRHLRLLGVETSLLAQLVPAFVEVYAESYPEIVTEAQAITAMIEAEETRFQRTLTKGLSQFEKAPPVAKVASESLELDNPALENYLSAELSFGLYETYGFPLEMSIEEAGRRGIAVPTNIQQLFANEIAKHQEKSRTASQGVFKGGLADHSTQTTRLHTATHLLHAGLRRVLGPSVSQQGSHITPERLRFDFSHDQPLTPEQIAAVESFVNQVVAADLSVVHTTEDKEAALAAGAMAFFREKYPDQVSVYTIAEGNTIYSKELCGGPHVDKTGKVGKLSIKRQESIGQGKRRVYAVVE